MSSLTKEELQRKAAAYFMERPRNFPVGRPYNCCESVLLALTDYLGVKSDLIPRLGTGVGAGVSLNGLLCGTISGSAIAIGIKYGRRSSEENPQVTWSKIDRFLEAFRARWGAFTCRELTKLNVKTPEGLKEYYRSVHDYACADRVRFAVGTAMDILSEPS